MLGRIAKSFFLNLLCGGLALAVVYLLLRDADSLIARIRQSLAEEAGQRPQAG